MGWVLITGCFGYAIGLATWRWLLGHHWRSFLPWILSIQALILMGAGLDFFADRRVCWFGAVFVFSAALPVVMAALHQAWVTLAPQESLPRYLSLRYGCEWAARFCAFFAVPLLVDNGLRPALDWPLWPSWLLASLGNSQGRVMAIAIGGLGWVIVAGLVWGNLCSGPKRSGCLPRRFEVMRIVWFLNLLFTPNHPVESLHFKFLCLVALHETNPVTAIRAGCTAPSWL